MRKKKIAGRLPVLFLICAALCMLSGCHGAKKMALFEVPEQFDEARKYTITFWAKNDTNKTQVDIYEKAIRDFQDIYPNITVDLRLYTDYGKIYNDVITNISTGTTPNVCITYPDHIATYLTGVNAVVPLDTLFRDPHYGLGGDRVRYDSIRQDEIVEKFLNECAFDGHYYAIPYMRSTEACYVNKTYVEALGYTLPETLTWDFVWEVSEAAAQKNEDGTYKINGQKVMIPFIYKSTDNMMIQMLKQKGAPYSDAGGGIYLFNDTTEALLYTIAEHTGNGAFSTFTKSGYPANFLNAGQCVFAVDSTAGATWMGCNAPLMDISKDKIVEFETQVMTVPQFDPDDPFMISQGPSVCVFNKEDPQEVLASWLFAQFLLTNDVQIAYSETEGYIPVTLRAQQSAEYQDYLAREGEDNKQHYEVKIKAAKLLIDNTERTFVTPVFNGSASLRNASGTLIETVVKNVKWGKTVDDAFMKNMYEDVRALYRLDQIDSTAGKRDLGPLPKAAVWLLGTLAAVWICILVYTVIQIKNKKSI